MLRYYKPASLAFWSSGDSLHDEMRRIVVDGSYTNGECLKQLVTRLVTRTGYEHAIPFGSGTQAIFLLARWYWKQGYRKIRVPAFTWPSTYLPFQWMGYGIRFVDIDRETWLADFGDMIHDSDELCIPVDTFGSSWNSASEGWEPPFVDSAQSLGAMWDDKIANRIISLSGSKILTTGEGGILLTQNQELADFATNQNWFSRLPELSAALGLAYLDHFDEILEKKREIAFRYEKVFGNLGNGSVQFQKIPVSSNHYIVAGLVDSPRDWQKANLDVEFRFYYSGIVSEEDEFVTYEKAEANQSHMSLPNTDYVSRHIIAFPAWPDMPLSEIDKMVEP